MRAPAGGSESGPSRAVSYYCWSRGGISDDRAGRWLSLRWSLGGMVVSGSSWSSWGQTGHGAGRAGGLLDGAALVVNPGQCGVTQPVHADLLSPHPGQLFADADPEVVVAAAADRLSADVTQQLPIRRCVPLLAMLHQTRHERGRDRLPADRLPQIG